MAWLALTASLSSSAIPSRCRAVDENGTPFGIQPLVRVRRLQFVCGTSAGSQVCIDPARRPHPDFARLATTTSDAARWGRPCNCNDAGQAADSTVSVSAVGEIFAGVARQSRQKPHITRHFVFGHERPQKAQMSALSRSPSRPQGQLLHRDAYPERRRHALCDGRMAEHARLDFRAVHVSPPRRTMSFFPVDDGR